MDGEEPYCRHHFLLHLLQGPCLIDNLIECRGSWSQGSRGTVCVAGVLRGATVTGRRSFGAVYLIGVNKKLQKIIRLTLLKVL